MLWEVIKELFVILIGIGWILMVIIVGENFVNCKVDFLILFCIIIVCVYCIVIWVVGY